jgi:hypothetical protein
MEEHVTQVNVERPEQEPPGEERQPWEQPKLERLRVSLDTAADGGSGSDAGGRTKSA